jgi:MFS family permease
LATIPYLPIRLVGVSAVGFLTYTGEYISYLVILASIQDKLVSQFQFGLYGTFVVGVIAGVYLIVSGLLAVPLGHWTDRYGRRVFTTLGSLIGGMALLALIGVGSIADSTSFLVGVGISLVALGFGHATYTASTWAYVGDISDEQNRGKSYGLLEIAEYGGFAFGPGIGIFVAATWGRIPTFALSAGLVLLGAIIAFLSMSESRKGVASQNVTRLTTQVSEQPGRITWGSFFHVLSNPVMSATLLTTFFMSLALQAFYIYVPLFAESVSNFLGPYGSLAGFLATLAAGTSIVMMLPFGFLVDATRRRMPWLVSGMLVGAISLVIVYLFQGYVVLAAAALVFGTALAIARVSQAVILADGSSPENRATVMGTNHAVEHAGYGVGAVTGGTLVALLGFLATFRDLALLLLWAAIIFFVFAVRKKLK